MKKIFISLFSLTLLCACDDDADTKDAYVDVPEMLAATDNLTGVTSNFKGVNWADQRDNFVDTWIILSGLEVTDDEVAVESKTDNILNAFHANGINTVRLPINPATVLQNWWPKHSLAISKSAAKGMKTIVAYWEGASSKDGKVDNETAFWMMWDRVVAKYIGNQNVYFEIFNEPHGYSGTDLKNLYQEWLEHYPEVPKHRILLDGTGYATGVNEIGDDARFDGCLLSFHYYTWFTGGHETTADWERPVLNLAYPERTVMTEFGCPMTNGKNFTDAPGYDMEENYLQGITAQLRERGIGSVYWPGIRTDDTYSMFNLSNGAVTVNNTSGLERLKYGWGEGTDVHFYGAFTGDFYKIVNRNSGKAVDVSGGSTDNGGNIIQWDYSGGNNQQWAFNSQGSGYYAVINRNSSKALDVNGASNDGGAPIIQWDYSGGNNQQWQVESVGFGYYTIINKNSSQSLDVNGGATWNGGDIIQWYWNNGNNQQWIIAAP
ncbi:Ricin B lectin [Flavobacterium akiainvivens]|uniref:Ricin B lectin n=1 Tax=Flavobacterium akiainvivens TaxID=1202724 RepID=A0A0M8MB97_9FLAO|nr:RICIN domain-containing protein [Flavobacterium akiainvivens]KOS07523.1 Ricin B lectin [Flavobacterium akiainvivens]SFQ63991.1 Ricin-type beta-trefoil lectin domain-like [Flavobacterium akiainvivens]